MTKLDLAFCKCLVESGQYSIVFVIFSVVDVKFSNRKQGKVSKEISQPMLTNRKLGFIEQKHVVNLVS